MNLILNTDSYKASHYLQYPPSCEYVSSYIESRGGQFDSCLFFGIQGFIKQYLLNPITIECIEEAHNFFNNHGLPFNKAGWLHILKYHDGYLPIKIEAIKEGTIVPTKNVLVQVVNTDPECFWLPNYVETALLRAVWYPTTVATLSWYCKKIIYQYLKETSDNVINLDFKLHDFGARGVSSFESASIGGAAHLLNFKSSDTISGVLYAHKYYHEKMAGYSISAAEHSTIISWGKNQESDAYEQIINSVSNDQHVAIVVDSYDIWYAIDEIMGKKLYSKIKNHGGTIILRPDSGDPIKILPKIIEKLMIIFGYIYNNKGYKILPSFIRVIQGDGVNLENIKNILDQLIKHKISIDNITFGMGSALVQKINRDTMQFAMKASAICVDSLWSDIYKKPTTDLTKESKAGRLALIEADNESPITIKLEELNNRKNMLECVYNNGRLMYDESFESIRNRILNY